MRVARFLPWGLALGLAGCTARPAVAPSGALVGIDATAVFAATRAREEQVRTLRVRFDARLEHQETSRSTSGVLVVEKPDRFRLRLLSPLGITVFDYVARGRRRRMVLATEGKVLDDEAIDRHAPFSPGALRAAFLRGADAYPGNCTPRPTSYGVHVECGAGDRTRRWLLIDPRTGDIDAEGDANVRLFFGEYDGFDGQRLPVRITVLDDVTGSRLTITVRQYEINPQLPAALFDPGEPAR